MPHHGEAGVHDEDERGEGHQEEAVQTFLNPNQGAVCREQVASAHGGGGGGGDGAVSERAAHQVGLVQREWAGRSLGANHGLP